MSCTTRFQATFTQGSARPAHVNLAALGGGSLGSGVIDAQRCGSCAMSACSSSRGSAGRTCSCSMQPPHAVHQGLLGASSSLSAPAPWPSEADVGMRDFSKRTSSDCLSGMDMIGDLFQQQATRLQTQLHQQLRDQAEIEHMHSQLAAASQQLKRLQVQNAELRRIADTKEQVVRSTYGHARSVQQTLNALLNVCEALWEDAKLLRRALREECPDRANDFAEVPRPSLPPKLPQLPPLEELLPSSESSSSEKGIARAHHPMETALALLSTVATHKADNSSAQPDQTADNVCSDAGSADQDSNQGSYGSASNQSSSNNGTEDTVLVNSNGTGNDSSHSKESLDEQDSGDGNGSSHGSDSLDGNANAESGNGEIRKSGAGNRKRDMKGSSNGDSDSNGDSNGTESLPNGEGSADTSASHSNSSSPPHDEEQSPKQSGSKRKR